MNELDLAFYPKKKQKTLLESFLCKKDVFADRIRPDNGLKGSDKYPETPGGSNHQGLSQRVKEPAERWACVPLAPESFSAHGSADPKWVQGQFLRSCWCERSASVSTGTFDLSETHCVCQCQSSFPGCSAQAGEVMGSFVGASQPLKSFSSDVKAIKRFSQVTELPRFGSRLLNASTLVLSQIPLDAMAHDIICWEKMRSPALLTESPVCVFGSDVLNGQSSSANSLNICCPQNHQHNYSSHTHTLQPTTLPSTAYSTIMISFCS
ncbi:unnamed protein product [Leuciscus chuanchicus]